MPVLTHYEARQRIFEHLSAMLLYWRDLDPRQVLAANPRGELVHERLSGFLFSVLVALDGGAGLPGFDLVPRDDEDWPTTSINSDVELHAAFPFSLLDPTR